MAITLDGFRILRRIGKNADTFAAARRDVDRAARTIVVTCLKMADLDGLRAVREALHTKPFALIVDGMKDADVSGVLAQLDPYFRDNKPQGAVSRRQRLVALAEGVAEPASAPSVTAGKKRPGRPAPSPQQAAPGPPRLRSDVMELFRKGGSRGD